MQKEYPISDLARIFPDMPPEDFAQLVASIREDGLMDPITVWQGRVIDGRHRYASTAPISQVNSSNTADMNPSTTSR